MVNRRARWGETGQIIDLTNLRPSRAWAHCQSPVVQGSGGLHARARRLAMFSAEAPAPWRCSATAPGASPEAPPPAAGLAPLARSVAPSGLGPLCVPHPGLAPGATRGRHFVAGVDHRSLAETRWRLDKRHWRIADTHWRLAFWIGLSPFRIAASPIPIGASPMSIAARQCALEVRQSAFASRLKPLAFRQNRLPTRRFP
jgi:hypothetical protein